MTTEIKLTMSQAKTIELEILSEVNRFCREHQLRYFINYGTLIGAIRHQGFIPWDDDIDIMMPREDYEQFSALFPQSTARYRVLSLTHDAQYFNNFIKVIDTTTRIQDNRNDKTYESGIFIDIFPLDYFDDVSIVDQTYRLESFKLLSFSKFHNIIYHDSWIKDAVRATSWLALRPVSPRWFAHRIDRAIAKKYHPSGQYAGLLGSKFKHKEVFERRIFDELIELPFEHLTVFAPKAYDALLRQYYGDYMQLPPVEKQQFPHELDAFQIVEGE